MTTILDQENLGITTPTKRKSYSILSPIGNLPSSENLKQRIISESTGLAKFTLKSLPEKLETPSVVATPDSSGKKNGLPIYIPSSIIGNETRRDDEKIAFRTKQSLLQEYAAKQQELSSLERQMERIQADLSEILVNLKHYDEASPVMSTANSSTNLEAQFNTLKQKASNIFVAPNLEQPDLEKQISTLKKKASSLFSSPIKENNTLTLKNSISNFLSIQNNSSPQKANIQKIFSDVKTRFDKQSSEFDDLTNKTSKFVNNFITNIQSNSPLKKKFPAQTRDIDDLANSSFNFENLSRKDRHEPNINTIEEIPSVRRNSCSEIFMSYSDEEDETELLLTRDILDQGILEFSRDINGVSNSSFLNPNDTIYEEQDEDDDNIVDIDDCNSLLDD